MFTTRKRLRAPRAEKELEEVGEALVTVPKRKRKRKRKPRAPSIKSKLLKKLRARRKIVIAERRRIDRDIRSLTCRRVKKQ